MEETLVGVIDFGAPVDRVDEAVGKITLRKTGQCDVKVKGNEGYIPHLHIENRSGYRCHICLLECLYFSHKMRESKLNDKQKSQFDEFMRQPNKSDPRLTNWQFAVQDWISRNDPNRVKMQNYINNRIKKGFTPSDTVQPDYTMLDNGPAGTIHEDKS